MENQAPNSRTRHIYVLGGHALATGYAQALESGRRDGQIAFDELFCVTDDPKAKAIASLGQGSVISEAPARFILDYAADPSRQNLNDTLVPDHTAKHVMLEVFMQMARERRPDLNCALSPFESDFTAPFSYKGENGALWALSHATWTCPPDCDEPEICPHIQANRDWNFFESLPKLFESLSDAEYAKYRFGCIPLFKEIAQIPLPRIVSSLRDFDARLSGTPPRQVIVATHSHCHGILGSFELKSTGK